jgi:hypothetical protein
MFDLKNLIEEKPAMQGPPSPACWSVERSNRVDNRFVFGSIPIRASIGTLKKRCPVAKQCGSEARLQHSCGPSEVMSA